MHKGLNSHGHQRSHFIIVQMGSFFHFHAWSLELPSYSLRSNLVRETEIQFSKRNSIERISVHGFKTVNYVHVCMLIAVHNDTWSRAPPAYSYPLAKVCALFVLICTRNRLALVGFPQPYNHCPGIIHMNIGCIFAV